MRIPIAVLAASLMVLALPAQGGKPNAGTNASQAEYDKLVAESDAANRAYATAMRNLQETADYKKAVEAKDREAVTKLSQSVPKVDRKSFATRAMALADQFAGEEQVPFLCWVANNGGDKELVKTAVDRLMKDHVKSKKLVDIAENGMVIGGALGREASDEMLARLVADNGDPMVRAWALYWQATQLTRGKDVSDENRAKADELLAQAAKLAPGTSLADRIAGPAFEKEHLQIGMTAPDIVGADVDGVAFKLSDYRGKVLVVDFWGFW
jgi:hypothetical protein